MDFAERVQRRNEFDASLVYGTRRFNLLTRRVQHYRHREKHDDHWIDTRTGVIARRYAKRRDCPLCGAPAREAEPLFIKSGFPHLRCLRCTLMFVSPILNEREYSKLWSAEDAWENVLESGPQIRMQRLEGRYSLDVMEMFLKKLRSQAAICDLGCGPGTMLIEAKKRGYYVFGVEPNVRCHKILARNGIDYIGGFFPLRSLPARKFDCVFLLNALEHMQDPFETLREAKKLLAPKGLIYISVPSADALVSRIMHEKAGVFGGHSHIQFFNAMTLARLLKKAGFAVLDSETIITEIGVIANHLGYKHPYLGDEAQVPSFLTPEAIYRDHLGRNVNVLARLK